jgi:NAD(P)H-hydrate repair Nnr-like enzyme with NAD(P)H-hydrate epimerase domain
MTITSVRAPAVGQRIGVVCGPGEFAGDAAGIVIAHNVTKWGTSALVLMDDGSTRWAEQLTTVGIGWRAL